VAAQAAAETEGRPAQTCGIIRNLAKIFGFFGFLLFSSVEWAAHCQRRSIQGFVDAKAAMPAVSEASSPPSHEKICHWEDDELVCDGEPRTPHASKWAAEPSVICPGTRFDQLGASFQMDVYKEFQVTAFLDEKVGHPVHHFQATGLLVTMLCLAVLLPGGVGLLGALRRIALATLLPSLAAFGVARMLWVCDGDDDRFKMVLIGCIASTILLAWACNAKTSRFGAKKAA
jgi:hypothetical protein